MKRTSLLSYHQIACRAENRPKSYHKIPGRLSVFVSSRRQGLGWGGGDGERKDKERNIIWSYYQTFQSTSWQWEGSGESEHSALKLLLYDVQKTLGSQGVRPAKINSRASGSKHVDDLPVKLFCTSPFQESTFSVRGVSVCGRQDEQPFWLISDCLLSLAASLFPPNKECKLILRLSPAMGFFASLGSGLLL